MGFVSNSELKYFQDNLLCRIEGQDQELAKGGEDEVTICIQDPRSFESMMTLIQCGGDTGGAELSFKWPPR